MEHGMTNREYDARVDKGTLEDITNLKERYYSAITTLEIWGVHMMEPVPTRSQQALQIILDACDKAIEVLTKEDN